MVKLQFYELWLWLVRSVDDDHRLNADHPALKNIAAPMPEVKAQLNFIGTQRVKMTSLFIVVMGEGDVYIVRLRDSFFRRRWSLPLIEVVLNLHATDTSTTVQITEMRQSINQTVILAMLWVGAVILAIFTGFLSPAILAGVLGVWLFIEGLTYARLYYRFNYLAELIETIVTNAVIDTNGG